MQVRHLQFNWQTNIISYNISSSTISKLINHSHSFVDLIIDKIKATQKILQDQQIIAENSTELIWIDEMYFKVGKLKFALIIAINNDYQVVGWKLSSTTNSKDIEEVLQQVDQNTNKWFILIGDGNIAYIKALKERRQDYYLIQHIHSKPWEVSKIHKFKNEIDGSLSHVIVEVNYNVFPNIAKGTQLELGYAVQKRYPPENKAKKRGRKKGSKNKTKHMKNTGNEQNLGIRGPTTARSKGKIFSISNNDGFMDVKWLDTFLQSKSSKSSKASKASASTTVNKVDKMNIDKNLKGGNIPDLETIQEILFMTFAIFGGKAIVSNLIESMNALVRNVIPTHGLKKEEHLLNHTNILMRIHSKHSKHSKPVNSSDYGDIQTYEQNEAMGFYSGSQEMLLNQLPVSAKIGLDNISQFMKVDIGQIRVITHQGGD